MPVDFLSHDQARRYGRFTDGPCNVGALPLGEQVPFQRQPVLLMVAARRLGYVAGPQLVGVVPKGTALPWAVIRR